jgi:hypothetical protein
LLMMELPFASMLLRCLSVRSVRTMACVRST